MKVILISIYYHKIKQILIVSGFGFFILSCSTKKNNDVPTIKSLLIHQLKNTHTNQDWFVPTKIAVKELTAE